MAWPKAQSENGSARGAPGIMNQNCFRLDDQVPGCADSETVLDIDPINEKLGRETADLIEDPGWQERSRSQTPDPAAIWSVKRQCPTPQLRMQITRMNGGNFVGLGVRKPGSKQGRDEAIACHAVLIEEKNPRICFVFCPAHAAIQRFRNA